MKVAQSCLTLCNPMDYGNSPGQDTGVDSLFLLQGIFPNPGIESGSPTLQVDSLPAELQGKPENTGLGSLIVSPGDLPDPGIELGCPALQANCLPTELPGKPLLHSSPFSAFCLMSTFPKFLYSILYFSFKGFT